MKKSMISSISNPLIKQVRGLRQKKNRRESGLFLVEGIHHVGEVIMAGWDVESIIYSPDQLTSSFAHEMISGLEFRPQPVTPQVMDTLTDKENPQGILAVVCQRKIKLETLDQRQNSVVLVSPQDPGNVGTILRTMDAVGLQNLFLLDGGVELYHPSVIRASMGTIFWANIVQTEFDVFIEWAKNAGVKIIGSSARGGTIYQPPESAWALILGNEQKGLSSDQLEQCHQIVSLPMAGRVSSLNLSVAAGVILYRFMQK